MHYLDNSATTRVCPEAAEAALQAMTVCFGNPSSTHTVGREAKKLLDSSRASVAGALGCQPHDLVFTSCGSESDNWALLAGAEYGRRKGRHIISSEAEHDAVRRSLDLLEERGFEVTKLKPDRSGAVPPDAVRRALHGVFDDGAVLLVVEGYYHLAVSYLYEGIQRGGVRTELLPFAEVCSAQSGIKLNCFTTQAGVQFYTGNYLHQDTAPAGKCGRRYPRRGGFCLETQHYPASPNFPQFPSTRLNPGERYHQETVYQFSIEA